MLIVYFGFDVAKSDCYKVCGHETKLFKTQRVFVIDIKLDILLYNGIRVNET